MSPEAQRIAIAEACGWKFRTFANSATGWVDDPVGNSATGWVDDPVGFIAYSAIDLPDYLNDLNAMHEAEKACLDTDSMNPISYCPYADALQDVCFDKTHWWCATAAQRAEAFLRTLGLWT